jgi:hypothetical protein
MKTNDTLKPADVLAMPLAEFQERFGFRPADALEKKFFAVTGQRPDAMQRDMIEMGILDPPVPDYGNVVMA